MNKHSKSKKIEYLSKTITTIQEEVAKYCGEHDLMEELRKLREEDRILENKKIERMQDNLPHILPTNSRA